jgi:ribosome-associated translation inhibitor RaiA
MQVQIRAKNFRIPDITCDEMERRVCFALSRFVARISLVTVTLADSNGPRGGVDKQCHLVVRLTPSGKVTIEERHADMSAAVALAADRAGWSVGRALKRRRDARRDRRSGETPPDDWGQSDDLRTDGA